MLQNFSKKKMKKNLIFFVYKFYRSCIILLEKRIREQMNIIPSNKENKVIYSWCPDIEKSALEQAKLLVEQPFVFKHVALMPDAHTGVTMPIGCILATKGIVIPVCVGVDIGCGMCACKTSLKVSDFTENKKEEILHSISRSIPVSFSHNNDKRKMEINGKMESIAIKLSLFCQKFLMII